jgi:hypothetical protein
LQFEWTNPKDGQAAIKPESTAFIGTSPEFEIAMYTLIALGSKPTGAAKVDGGREVTKLKVAEYDLTINCVKWGNGSKTKIRTCYPAQVKW